MAEIQIREYLDVHGESPWLRWRERLDAEARARVSRKQSTRRSATGPTFEGGTPCEEEDGNMALTRDFRETICADIQRDPRFLKALFIQAINAYLEGEISLGRSVLRDIVNATVGFEALAEELGKPSKSLHRMLGPRGNPSTENFFAIVGAVQKRTGLRLRVTADSQRSLLALKGKGGIRPDYDYKRARSAQ
jgi:DNA-binding phage protein